MNELIFNPLLRAALWPFDCFPQAKPRPVSIKRVLIAQLAHLGDTALTTSLMAPLKHYNPQIEIGFLTSSRTRALIEDHPDIALCHTFDHPLNSRGRRQKGTPLSLLSHYDLAIDASPYFPNAIPLFRLARIPMSIGFTSGGFSRFLTHPIRWIEDERHLIEKLCDLLIPLGIENVKPNYSLPVTSRERQDYWLVQLCGGAAHKIWSYENWRALFEKMGDVHIKIVGSGAKERALAARLVAHENNLVDRLCLKELKVCVACARGFIGVDSIGGHLAAAYGVPSVILAHPCDNMKLWRPYATNAHVLPLSASPEIVYQHYINA